MNTPIRWALACTATLWALAAAAAEPPLPPSAALTDANLVELTGQKAPKLRHTQPDQVTPKRHSDGTGFDRSLLRKKNEKRWSEKPRGGGCIAIYPRPSTCPW